MNLNITSDRLFKLNDVIRITTLSRSAIYRQMATGEFPPPIRVAPQSVAWTGEALMQWADSRPVGKAWCNANV